MAVAHAIQSPPADLSRMSIHPIVREHFLALLRTWYVSNSSYQAPVGAQLNDAPVWPDYDSLLNEFIKMPWASSVAYFFRGNRQQVSAGALTQENRRRLIDACTDAPCHGHLELLFRQGKHDPQATMARIARIEDGVAAYEMWIPPTHRGHWGVEDQGLHCHAVIHGLWRPYDVVTPTRDIYQVRLDQIVDWHSFSYPLIASLRPVGTGHFRAIRAAQKPQADPYMA